MRKHDPEILEKMLQEPEYKKKADAMNSQELARYKILLVGRGAYGAYVKGLEKKSAKRETKKAE